jgi:hypothetical protein
MNCSPCLDGPVLSWLPTGPPAVRFLLSKKRLQNRPLLHVLRVELRRAPVNEPINNLLNSESFVFCLKGRYNLLHCGYTGGCVSIGANFTGF